MSQITVHGLALGEDPAVLGRLGLDATTLDDGSSVAHVGGVALHAVGDGDGPGLLGLDLAGAGAPVPTSATPRPGTDGLAPTHPLGAVAVDHVVVLAGDADAAVAAFGVSARRREQRGGRVYAYILAGSCLIEVVAPAETDDRRPRLWGVALSVRDLDAAKRVLGDALGDAKDAVQPGRRIATVRGDAIGLHTPLVLLTPR